MSDFLDLHGSTSKVLRALADRDMRRLGLHLGQNHVLAALWEQDGRTPGEMAAALNVSTPTVVKAATRMTAAGLLVRRPDDRDNRLVRLWLTDKGRDLQKPVEADRKALEDKVTAALTPTERKHLMSALTKIHHTATDLLGTPVDPASLPD
ncbi:MarR family winged helix-turn-helix transcriptional regulator [Nocardia sp. NBC_01388]|uniref:MarR family winged helix-turn-helix transcriptional regulator n=1 Tax=Nocardia sp. NBC_01388 TaxID=2903596 RepID=UPI00324C7DEB